MQYFFVKYEEAIAMKELGFDEPCLADYVLHISTQKYNLKFHEDWYNQNMAQYDINNKVAAPLYQQAFKWFRDKHKLCSFIEDIFVDGTLCFVFQINKNEKH